MDHIGTWVNNADAKIGLLATAMTILATGMVRQRERVADTLAADLGARGFAALLMLAVSVAALLVAGWWLLRALRPRRYVGQPSRFAFPDLAGADLAALADYDPGAARVEAWIQAQTLAKIVDEKYRCFSHALAFASTGGGAFAIWLLTVPHW